MGSDAMPFGIYTYESDGMGSRRMLEHLVGCRKLQWHMYGDGCDFDTRMDTYEQSTLVSCQPCSAQRLSHVSVLPNKFWWLSLNSGVVHCKACLEGGEPPRKVAEHLHLTNLP